MRGIFIQMNEQSAERQIFRPTKRYVIETDTVIHRLFETPPPPMNPEIDVPVMIARRSWQKNGMLFWAMAADPQYVHLLDGEIEEEQVTLMRLRPTEDGLIEVRSYLYYRDNGDLQVANWLFTEEEVENMDFSTPQGEQQGKAIAEGFNMHAYTASAVDYSDFLADIDGFSQHYLI
jgi:hypothetical protein